MTMGRIEKLEIGEEGNLSKCALTLIAQDDHQVKVIIPLEGLVDIEEEVKRIQKNTDKLNKDISSLSGKLNNENFVKNATPEVVEADRILLEQSRKQLASMQEALVRLQS
jgi:valyl-tRNA synthetase